MFTSGERAVIRDQLVDRARADLDVVGAALVGSAARGAEDEWSDIDLALQLGTTADEPAVVERWTRWLDDEHGVADAFDVNPSGVRYRVFLLTSSLQIDLSFWPREAFRATEPAFELLFGEANPASVADQPDVGTTIGMGWLYAVHARSALARGRLWQTQMMLDGVRDQTVVLACLRHGLNPWHGREVDRLPDDVLDTWAAGRARSVRRDELARSHRALLDAFLTEVHHHDAARAEALRRTLA